MKAAVLFETQHDISQSCAKNARCSNYLRIFLPCCVKQSEICLENAYFENLMLLLHSRKQRLIICTTVLKKTVCCMILYCTCRHILDTSASFSNGFSLKKLSKSYSTSFLSFLRSIQLVLYHFRQHIFNIIAFEPVFNIVFLKVLV